MRGRKWQITGQFNGSMTAGDFTILSLSLVPNNCNTSRLARVFDKEKERRK